MVRRRTAWALVLSATLPACGSSPGTAAPGPPTFPAGVATCYTPLADQHPATLAFRAALSAGDLNVRSTAIDGLTAAVTANPQEEELALLLGLAHLWRIAAPLPAEASDGAVILQSVQAATTNLETAFQLCPTDYRIPAWLGVILVKEGRVVNDQATLDKGLGVLQQGIDHYPSFVLFSKLLAYADLPATDPSFQMALDAVDSDLGACRSPAAAADPACIDEPLVPHNMEGAGLFLGDVFAKAGRKTDAVAAYQGAKAGGGYGSWSFQAMLDDRLATIDARIAASMGAGEPDVMWSSPSQCAVCHTQ
jgi:hypothetical protein